MAIYTSNDASMETTVAPGAAVSERLTNSLDQQTGHFVLRERIAGWLHRSSLASGPSSTRNHRYGQFRQLHRILQRPAAKPPYSSRISVPVRVLYRPHHKALRINELRKVFFDGYYLEKDCGYDLAGTNSKSYPPTPPNRYPPRSALADENTDQVSAGGLSFSAGEQRAYP